MKKLFTFIIMIALFLSSCEKSGQTRITYVATEAISAYNLQYLNAQGELQNEAVQPESAQDQWKYEYMADEGDIIYISGNYKDIQSALKIMIMMNGKIYKQAANEADTLKYLTLSGTVPFKE